MMLQVNHVEVEVREVRTPHCGQKDRVYSQSRPHPSLPEMEQRVCRV